jgi:hypothetical protein
MTESKRTLNVQIDGTAINDWYRFFLLPTSICIYERWRNGVVKLALQINLDQFYEYYRSDKTFSISRRLFKIFFQISNTWTKWRQIQAEYCRFCFGATQATQFAVEGTKSLRKHWIM